MFKNITSFFKRIGKKGEEKQSQDNSKNAAKERLHLVLMQDRANVSADFLELMKQEIIEVIKKYIEIDEKEIDVRLTNKENEDGTNGAPALYANIPILNMKNDLRKINDKDKEEKHEDKVEENKKDIEKSEKQEENKEKSEKETKEVIEEEKEKQKEENKTEEKAKEKIKSKENNKEEEMI